MMASRKRPYVATQNTQLNQMNVYCSCTGFALVLNKPSAASPVSLAALMKALNSSQLATFRPRPVFTGPAGRIPPCPPFFRLGMKWSVTNPRLQLVQGPAWLHLGPDHIAPPRISPPMGHRLGVSLKQCQRHLVSTPVTTCRNRPTHPGGIVPESRERECVYSIHTCLCVFKSTVCMCKFVTVTGLCIWWLTDKCNWVPVHWALPLPTMPVQYTVHTTTLLFSLIVNDPLITVRLAQSQNPEHCSRFTDMRRVLFKRKTEADAGTLKIHSLYLSHQPSLNAKWRFTHPQLHKLWEFTQSILELSYNLRQARCKHNGSSF